MPEIAPMAEKVKRAIEASSIIDFRVRVPSNLFPVVDLPEALINGYDAVLNTRERFFKQQSLDDLLALMDRSGVGHALMHAEHEAGDIADTLNHTVADVVAKHPDRFTGVGAISLQNFSIPRALQQIDDCANLGFVGISVQPAFFHMAINDKRLYPVYAKAMEKGLFIALHVGINYSLNCPMSGENPMLLDEVACDFPDLTIIASHAGWPWVAEMVAVARKHPNIYMEFGGLAPKYIGQSGSGWEMMHKFMNSLLADQILFATDWATMDHARCIQEWQAMGLKPQVEKALLAGNARRLLSKVFSPGD